MTLSARNVFRGTIVNATRGATTAHVKIDVGGKTVVTASITMEAVDARGLEKGDAALATIKASQRDGGEGVSRRPPADPRRSPWG